MSTQLLKDTIHIGEIAGESAEAYDRALTSITADVNLHITSLPSFKDLIGGNPTKVALDNHGNHAVFIRDVLTVGSWELLVSILPWVYRSYMSHGFSKEYFPAVIRAFMKAVSEHLPQVAADDVNRLYQWILDHHDRILEESSRRPDDIAFSTSEPDARKDEFLKALLRGDMDRCYALARELMDERESLERLYLDLMQPALYDVGDLWERNEVSVAQEHLATAIVGRIMAKLYGHVFSGERSEKGKAVVAAFMNEYHEIGARMVSDVLESDGWKVDYLGAHVPLQDLVKFLRDTKPFLLGISLSMPFNLAETAKAIRLIRNDGELGAVRIMVGGLALLRDSGIWKALGADGFARDARGAMELAGKWWSESS